MLNKSIHRLNLIKILNKVYKDSELAAVLGFKGGTAAYLFYNLPRFSTDLDFDILSKNSDFRDLQSKISIMMGNSYEILDKWEKNNTLIWELSYEKGLTNIKIEISKRDASIYKYNKKDLYGSSINLITPEHLVVQKLLALKGRSIMANRDIFDINYFFKNNFEPDLEVLGKASQVSPKEFFSDLIGYLEDNKPRSILDGLGEVVEEDMKNWIRNEMFDETLELLKMRRDNL